jgi:hypothetical protein
VEGMTTMKEGEQFHWDTLVPRVVHSLKVAIVEAMLWLDQPLSSSDLVKLMDDSEINLSHVAYHVSKLVEVGALEAIRNRQVRGATETFYFFR